MSTEGNKGTVVRRVDDGFLLISGSTQQCQDLAMTILGVMQQRRLDPVLYER